MRDRITEFFRDLYEKEHATKERINANLPFWLTLYSMQVAISAYYLSILEDPYFELSHVLFYIPFIVSLAFLGNSVYSVVTCFKGSEYAFLGKPLKYYDYYRKAKNTLETSEKFDAAFIEKIEEQYARAADINREINKRRLETNLHAVKNAFVALALLIIAFPGNVLIKADAPERDQGVTVGHPIQIIMSNDKESSSQSSQSEEPIAQAPDSVPLEFPNIEFINECLANSEREAAPDLPDPPEPLTEAD